MFESSGEIDNKYCLSLLVQILETQEEYLPAYYIAYSEDNISSQHLVALSESLALVKYQVDKLIERVENA